MRRVCNSFAYSSVPRDGCWWDETVSLPKVDRLDGGFSTDVAIIGGGYTGLSAAICLAEAGADVTVLEARDFGWGASGRNGGFCCLGGAKASDAWLDVRHGRKARLAFRRAEKAAVHWVESFLQRHSVDVDRHSLGETQLAHRARDLERMRRERDRISENYGVEPQITEATDLAKEGLGGGPFHGAVSIPLGFGLNPRKYLRGLMEVALGRGTRLLAQAEVHKIQTVEGGHILKTRQGDVRAKRVIVATNGYSSEDLPDWLGGRFLPAQSTVIVTRPLTASEQADQGWFSDQMCFDSRDLLHYFRKMPDGRFLFGMRGGVFSSPRAEAAARARTRAHFDRMFPKWRHVETTHAWSGMVSLARNRIPFLGRIPQSGEIWGALCYHGNGVAMGSFSGKLLADLMLDREVCKDLSFLQSPLGKFPFGRARRMALLPLYGTLMIRDAL